MTKLPDAMSLERLSVAVGITVFVLAIGSSIATLLLPGHTIARQLLVLLHLASGLTFAILSIPYTLIHFRRTAFFRRPTMIASGVVLVALIVMLAWTGIHHIVYGRIESAATIAAIHWIAGTGLVLLVVIHATDHFFRMPERRKTRGDPRFLSVPARSAQVAAISVVICASLIAAGQWLLPTPDDFEPASPAVANYQYPYGEHPFRPSQTETTHDGFVHESEIANTQYCLNCHSEIGEQWMSSIHRQAALDPTYVTIVNVLEQNQGIEATRYCEGCHTPVALLTGQLSRGGSHGAIAGTPGNLQGVNCMGCHGISSLVHLKGVASYEFQPHQRYLFQDSTSPLLASINRLLVRVDPTQHKADMGRDLIRDSQVCAACHVQFMDKDMNGWGWVKMQDEYSAWLASPFSRHEEEFATEDAVVCQDCHMPMVAADDPAVDDDGMVRSHYFAAANTFLPMLLGDEDQLRRVVDFLTSNKIRVTIDKPNRSDSRQDLRPIDESIRGSAEAPFYAYLGETVELDLIVSNVGVGHDFPAGTIDLGEGWIDLSVVDAQGTSVYRSGTLDDAGNVEDGAHLYKAVPISRDGREIWQHFLFDMVGESFRRVIPAGDADLVSYSFAVPGWAKSPLTVTAVVKYRKLNDRFARFALGERYLPVPVVEMATDSLRIPLRTRPEIELSVQTLNNN